MKRWKKALALALCLVLALPLQAGAANETVERAYALNDLGLFQGTDSGFELDKRPTRVEGMTMFVRLLGGEKEAKDNNYAHPFTDVPKWGDPYVGYAWEHGLTKGTGKGLFGSTAYITLEEYVTFVLRALGYDDSQGDFTWKTSVDKAVEIGLLTRDQAAQFLGEATSRGTMVDVSYAALTQTFKGEERTLAEKLVDEGVFTRELAIQKGVWPAQTPDATPSPTESVKPSATPRPTESAKPSETPRPSESLRPGETPEPSRPPVENKGGEYALLTDVSGDGAAVGDVMKPMRVEIIKTDGSTAVYAVHKDSTYSDAKLIRDAKDQQGLLAPGGLIEYSIVENMLLIKSIANQAGNAGTVSYGNKIWNKDTKYLNYGTGTAMAASDAVVFMSINDERQYVYSLRDLPDLYADQANNTSVQYFKNSSGAVIAASWASSKKPNATAETLYGIVTGRAGNRKVNGEQYIGYTVALDEDTVKTIYVDDYLPDDSGVLVQFDEASDECYVREDIKILTGGKEIANNKWVVAAVRSYEDRSKLLSYFLETSRTDVTMGFEGGIAMAITVDKDVVIVYVDMNGKKAGPNIGVTAFDTSTGYANVLFHINDDGVVDVIFVETSGEDNIVTTSDFGKMDEVAVVGFGTGRS